MKTKSFKPVTIPQIKKIHVLLSQKGLMDEKKGIVWNLTSGRTESTKELSFEEARRLIDFLSTDEKELSEKKKIIYRAVWKIAWEMDIIYGDTQDDYEMNKAKLNMFARERGAIKKNFSEMTLDELKKTHRQFEAMYAKHKKKSASVAVG